MKHIFPRIGLSWLRLTLSVGTLLGCSWSGQAQTPLPDMLVGVSGGTCNAYQNTGTCGSPVLTRNATWDVPDIGSDAAPGHGDFDGDGDFDLLIGSSSGSGLVAYKNTGSGSSPAWTAWPAWNLSYSGSGNIKVPAFSDLDNDGDLDIMVGNTNGICYGYINNGTIAAPAWVANPAWDSPDVGSNASPALVDLDADGDYDILVAKNLGITWAYRNTGSYASPTWTRYATWDPPTIVSTNTSISTCDRDCDGDYDLYIGSSLGTAFAYRNTGSATSPTWSYLPGLNIVGLGTNTQVLMLDLNENATYTYQTITSGNWSSATTWSGGNVPKVTDVSGNVIVAHDLTVPSGSLKVKDGGSMIINGATLTISSGTLFVTNGDMRVAGGMLSVNGSVQISSESSSLYLTNTEIDLDGNLINDEGVFYFSNQCGSIADNFMSLGGIDTFLHVQLDVGTSAGNFQNDQGSSMYITDSRVKVNGIFRNESGSTISGDIDAIWSTGGSLINNVATWNLSVGAYCVPGSVTAPPAYLPAAQDCAGIDDQFDDCSSFLPVTMVNFSAGFEFEAVLLKWQTAVELNSDYYTVERSLDGSTWIYVGRVASHGNSTVLQTYTLRDEAPFAGLSYYRLTATDLDGTSQVVGLKQIENNVSGLMINVNPHPMTNESLIFVSSEMETTVELSIFNVMGTEVYRNVIELTPNNSISLNPTRNLLPGNYLMTWSSGSQIKSRVLIVVNP